MLLIQNINLCWSKNERGTDYAEVRRQFPPAYPLEKNMPMGNVVVHYLHFRQSGECGIDSILENRRYRVQHYCSVEEVNLPISPSFLVRVVLRYRFIMMSAAVAGLFAVDIIRTTTIHNRRYTVRIV